MGPPMIGYLADIFTRADIAAGPAADLLSAKCSFTDLNLTEDLRALCQQAKSQGMKAACMIAAGFFGLSALFFLLSRRTLKQDLNQG